MADYLITVLEMSDTLFTADFSMCCFATGTDVGGLSRKKSSLSDY